MRENNATHYSQNKMEKIFKPQRQIFHSDSAKNIVLLNILEAQFISHGGIFISYLDKNGNLETIWTFQNFPGIDIL